MDTPQSHPTTPPTWRKLLTPAVILIVLSFSYFDAFKKFDNILWDGFFSLRHDIMGRNISPKTNTASKILIIEIDSKSINAIGRWPWNRSIYSAVLNKLVQGSPDSIFIDIDFSARSNNNDEDRLLSETINTISNSTLIQLPVFLQNTSTTNATLSLQRPFFKTTNNIELVSVNIKPSIDGLVRKVSSGFNWEGTFYRSAWNSIADSNISSTLVDFSIRADSFNYLSAVDLLNYPVEQNQFKDMNVIIGSTAIELGDIISVPAVQAIPGVVLHALAIETLNQGGLYSISSAALITLLILVALISSYCFVKISWRKGLIAGTVFIGATFTLDYFLYEKFHLITPTFPIWVMIFAVGLSHLFQTLDESTLQKIALKIALNNRIKLLESVFNASNECILSVNEEGIIFSANPKSKDIFRCDSSELIGKPISHFLRLPNTHSDDEDSWQHYKEQFDCEIKNASRMLVPVQVCISPIDSKNEKKFIFAIRSLEERIAKEAQLKYALEYDKTTGLINREKLFSISEEFLKNSRKRYLFKIDIEYFNDVISIYGHDIGEKVLESIIARIKKNVPVNTITSRIGKTELALLICDIDIKEADQLAKILISDLNHTFTIKNNNIEIFCHIGIATDEDRNVHIEKLIRYANLALNTARRKGLEYDWCIKREDDIHHDRLSILGSIRQTLRKSEFDLAFQPKVDLKSNEFLSCEVLLRAPHDNKYLLSISKLIETAEKSSLIASITLWVLTKTLSIEKEWEKCNLPKKISINLSVGLIGNDDFLEKLITLLRTSNNYFQITFEITETYFSEDWQHSLMNLNRLRQHNVNISVDDYGTGYSSLSYLKDLQASELKIDRSFISNINEDKEKQLIVKSTIHMAHELHMTVVAEGIETQKEHEFLLDSGCDIGQGYLYAKPMTFAQLKTFTPPQLESSVSNINKLPHHLHFQS